MSGVFVYLDNSNIFHAAQDLAEERNGDANARHRVRIDFENLLRLAHADRPLGKALAAGSIPPALSMLWNELRRTGVEVHLYDRGEPGRGEQETPDYWLQLRMLEDTIDYNDNPGIVALLTGDGAGYNEGRGFHRTLERMHRRGWQVEVLSWEHSANTRMREWVETNGVFVPLDDYYEAITYTTTPRIGQEPVSARDTVGLDLSTRPMRKDGTEERQL